MPPYRTITSNEEPDSQADFLMTGAQDLLILQQFGITKIVTYQQFLVICRLG